MTARISQTSAQISIMACHKSYLVQRHWHRKANTILSEEPRFQRMVILQSFLGPTNRWP